MQQNQPTKYFGTFIDRNFRIIRLNFLKVFKDAAVDITTEQWVILDILYQENELSQNVLAERSFKDAPTISRIIDLLCKKGFTERQRSESDKRRHKIHLTENGKMVYEKLLPKVTALRKQGWDGLSDEDYRHFLRIMDQVFENFQER